VSILKEVYGFCDSGREDCPHDNAAATVAYSNVADVRHHMRFSDWKIIKGEDWCGYCVQSRIDDEQKQ